MSNYVNQIEQAIKEMPCNKLFEASELYKTSLCCIPEMTFYKNIERKTKKGEIRHLAKGLYYKPKESILGKIPITTEEIIRHYTEENSGITVGYQLYNRERITTQIGRRI